MATQNPVETLGCFPLPEAQLDRFLMKITMDSLKHEEERRLIDRFILDEPLAELKPVAGLDEAVLIRKAARNVRVHADLRDYLVSLVQATRSDPTQEIREGVSPRGTLALLRASQGYALLMGRSYLVPEDIKAVAVPVMAHRMLSEDVSDTERARRIRSYLHTTPVPTEDWSRS